MAGQVFVGALVDVRDLVVLEVDRLFERGLAVAVGFGLGDVRGYCDLSRTAAAGRAGAAGSVVLGRVTSAYNLGACDVAIPSVKACLEEFRPWSLPLYLKIPMSC